MALERVKDLARVLPDCVTLVRRLRKDDRVPRKAKAALAFAGLWLLSPIDLIPEFVPVLGPLDDAVVVALALRYVARSVPREALTDAWPGDPACCSGYSVADSRQIGERGGSNATSTGSPRIAANALGPQRP